MLNRFRPSFVALAIFTSACTISETPAPSLMGPSEYATSVTLSAVPDLDHARRTRRSRRSSSPRTIRRAAPIRSLQLRLDMVVNGALQDFGTLSTRTLFTDADGRATSIYTAPPAPTFGASIVTDHVTFVVTPVGSNAQNAKYTTAEVRLVLPTTTIPGAPVAFFTYAPASGITTATDVAFNASGSYPVNGSRIVNYAWDWGDGTTDNFNASAAEDHDWAGAGQLLGDAHRHG